MQTFNDVPYDKAMQNAIDEAILYINKNGSRINKLQYEIIAFKHGVNCMALISTINIRLMKNKPL